MYSQHTQPSMFDQLWVNSNGIQIRVKNITPWHYYEHCGSNFEVQYTTSDVYFTRIINKTKTKKPTWGK